jgi:hypothetical protein
MFLTAYYVGLHFFGDFAQFVKLAASSIQRQTIDIQAIESGDIRWFSRKRITP